MRAFWPCGNSQFWRFQVGQSAEDGIARRIVAAIKDQIHGGAYRAGDRLPSTRAFAAEWGASRTTVTAAYGQLIAEGYLATRPGARAVVANGLGAPAPSPAPSSPARPVSAFARRLPATAKEATDTFRLADFRYGDLSDEDFPAIAWRRALSRALVRRTGRLRYGDPQGSPTLRTALQGYLWRARGITCSEDQIVIVNGSQQGLDLCARLLLDPGDRFVIENPGYLLARQAFEAVGATGIPLPVDGDGLVTDDLPEARLAYVTPSHQFPLGSVLPASRRRALIGWAQRFGAYVVEDDYDGEYRHDIAPIPPLRSLDPDAVIYVGTFSKTLSPTLRLGYLVVPASLRHVFREAKRLADRHTPRLEQDALADLLASGAYERHVRGNRRRNAERRTLLLEGLARELGPAVSVVGAETGLHVVMWLRGVGPERTPDILRSAQAAGIGLYSVLPLYDPRTPPPAEAGFVLGYAGLGRDALQRGVKALSGILARCL